MFTRSATVLIPLSSRYLLIGMTQFEMFVS